MPHYVTCTNVGCHAFMMRFPILIAILIKVSLSSAQTLRPGYFYSTKQNELFNSELIQLNADSTFQLLMFGCIENEIGQGRYTITKDTLTLLFQQHPLEPTQIVQFEEGTNDSLTLTISAMSVDSTIFPGVNCYLKQAKKGSTTDLNGRANLTLSKPLTEDTLVIQALRHSNIEIPIQNTSDNVKIRATISEAYFHKNGEKQQLKIEWIRSVSLGLRRFDNMTISYKRISPEQGSEIRSRITR